MMGTVAENNPTTLYYGIPVTTCERASNELRPVNYDQWHTKKVLTQGFIFFLEPPTYLQY